MPKITKRTVDAASPDPGGRRFYVWDSQLVGFGVLVLPSGVKSYIYRYRTAEGRERRATIGKHGDFTPDQARERADELRQAVKSGRDPLGEKAERQRAPTVADLLDAYAASEKFKGKAPSTQGTDRGRIERHLKPTLGRKIVDRLTPDEVQHAFAAIRDGKTAVSAKTCKGVRAPVTGGAGTARKAIRLLHAAFAWATHERIVSVNPCTGVETGSDGSRDTILEDAADYGRLFGTLQRMEDEKRIRGPVADAIRILALTGSRRGEITGLKWRHVDLKKGLIVLPPSAHKTGKATGKARLIALPSAAQAIIARQPGGQPDDYVFRAGRGNGPVHLTRPWQLIRVEADLPAGIGLHALRHSVASHLAMAGGQAAEVMATMGHRQLSTVARYIHFAQDARQALAERAAAVVTAGMAAAGTEKDGEVVSLKGGCP